MLLPSASRTPHIVGPEHDGWDRYVAAHPKGSIFHTTGMIRVFAATPNFQPLGYAALDADGEILAMIVCVHVQTIPNLPALASRAVQFAEPLCQPTEAGVAALSRVLRRMDTALKTRSLLSEIRCLHAPEVEQQAMLQHGYELLDYINYEMDLGAGEDALWHGMHKRVRQKIRATFRKGVRLQDDRSEAGLQRLYGLLRHSYGRARVPLPSNQLFENAVRLLPAESVRVRTAVYQDRPVASIMSLAYGDRVFSWYGGTERVRGLSPFAAIVWDDIRWASQAGYRHYDFGGAGWPDQDYGPRRFKAGFGGREVRYGRYLLSYSPVRLRLAKLAYRVSQQLGAWS
ncbi:lipid II:glycine glycyltransferase FemX [Roseimaritima sediminicola]|uniref:lipid II:glycine glycyltransferase FemX n=1 Tax=Roseimaritima sediminicola TaxID=2662066 RepID=UPI0012982D4D|nr:GNAT family N-acetyltransferase [Roseimaritima sediminicola]